MRWYRISCDGFGKFLSVSLIRTYLTCEQIQGMSWQTCEDTVCRPEFAANGTLDGDANNMTSRAITEYHCSLPRLFGEER